MLLPCVFDVVVLFLFLEKSVSRGVVDSLMFHKNISVDAMLVRFLRVIKVFMGIAGASTRE